MKNIKIKLDRNDFCDFCEILQKVIEFTNVDNKEREAMMSMLESIACRVVPRKNEVQNSYKVSFSPMEWVIIELTVGQCMRMLGVYEDNLWSLISIEVEKQFERAIHLRKYHI